tara:strand:- start:1571 stop:2662 length:1092 start_codon:yes stop_codon:yes gene_type:complete
MEDLRKSMLDNFFACVKSFVRLSVPTHAASAQAQIAMMSYEMQREQVEAFHTTMSDECPTLVSYSKAFSRMQGRPITLYDVTRYRDVEAMIKSGLYAGPLEALGATITEKEIRVVCRRNADALWDCLDALCNAAYACATLSTYGTPSIPTAESIAENIKQTKERKKTPDVSGPTVDQARCETLVTAIKNVFVAGGEPEPTVEAGSIATLDKGLASMASEGSVYGDLAVQKDIQRFSQCPALVKMGLPPLDDSTLAAWTELADACGKSHSLTQMQRSIPKNMMATIEKQAAALASGMGPDGDLSQLDLSTIGESVLSQCSPEDLTQLAGNMGDILPKISGLAASLERETGGVELPPEVGSMLKG